MMDWLGMQWDTQSEKDTANQSNADINNQNITLVNQSSDRDNLLFKIRSSSWFPLFENDNLLRVCLSKHQIIL